MSVFRLAAATMAAAIGFGLAGAAQAYTVYISNEKGNSHTVIDSDTLEVQTTIPVGQRPRGILITKDGKHLLVCASDDDTVQVFDTKMPLAGPAHGECAAPIRSHGSGPLSAARTREAHRPCLESSISRFPVHV